MRVYLKGVPIGLEAHLVLLEFGVARAQIVAALSSLLLRLLLEVTVVGLGCQLVLLAAEVAVPQMEVQLRFL